MRRISCPNYLVFAGPMWANGCRSVPCGLMAAGVSGDSTEAEAVCQFGPVPGCGVCGEGWGWQAAARAFAEEYQQTTLAGH